MITSEEYESMFHSCKVDSTISDELKSICNVATFNMLTYDEVAAAARVPWMVIAAIHYRESSQNFTRHLHNGDPLTARTVHVPANRPVKGEPPFTWVDSAIDALTGFWRPTEWNFAGSLEFCERYNGLGYQKKNIFSPYVWGRTDKYTGGLFVADGTLDMTKKDERPGVAAIFRTLIEMGDTLDFTQCLKSTTVVH